MMLNAKLIEEISLRISKMLSETPAAEVETNLRALLQGIFIKLELVSREEFDVQSQVLSRTRAQLERLEQRLAALEARLPK